MEQKKRFEPSQFIRLFEEFNTETKNPIRNNGRQSSTGITEMGTFYSIEVLFEMLLTVSATYGRLAYKQDQSANEGTLSAIFKKLSIGFLHLANSSYHITNADNIIKFTELASKNIACLKDFEDADEQNG